MQIQEQDALDRAVASDSQAELASSFEPNGVCGTESSQVNSPTLLQRLEGLLIGLSN